MAKLNVMFPIFVGPLKNCRLTRYIVPLVATELALLHSVNRKSSPATPLCRTVNFKDFLIPVLVNFNEAVPVRFVAVL